MNDIQKARLQNLLDRGTLNHDEAMELHDLLKFQERSNSRVEAEVLPQKTIEPEKKTGFREAIRKLRKKS